MARGGGHMARLSGHMASGEVGVWPLCVCVCFALCVCVCVCRASVAWPGGYCDFGLTGGHRGPSR